MTAALVAVDSASTIDPAALAFEPAAPMGPPAAEPQNWFRTRDPKTPW